ncbi:expressed unknown protein [Ectocarpus siliculosus]|uniref:Uncharacterized protein n=1 Tax=Ectocarpus siliculosus TaxID=2880 RepID=D8LLM2_ECTSI|nr:expressed unknown protein [Ectocarpus siliculosus]|eukprot:CBN74653.1 expressed unknown protein [Ectocarpus siliculosus]
MLDEKQDNEFHIIVNNEKLEEIKANDGNTYVVMPLFSKVSYGVEFVEEVKGHGAAEKISQKWPVCPYKVVVRNLSAKIQKTTLYVDGQKVCRKHVRAGENQVFEGIPTAKGIQELLFSLPRFTTLKEQQGNSGGRALKKSRTSEIGVVKIVWNDCVKTGKRSSSRHRKYSTTSFTQANKSDAKATGAGAGGGSSEKAFASTTRAGKVIRLNEPKSCTVSTYHNVGKPWEARLLYRTEHHLQDIGVLGTSETAAQEIERKAKRARRRKKAKLQGGPSSPPVLVMEDDPPPLVAATDVKPVL